MAPTPALKRDAAERLHEALVRFQEADRQLALPIDDTIVGRAIEYSEARRAHQAAIKAFEAT